MRPERGTLGASETHARTGRREGHDVTTDTTPLDDAIRAAYVGGQKTEDAIRASVWYVAERIAGQDIDAVTALVHRRVLALDLQLDEGDGAPTGPV
jgi:hypothetical protein